MLTTLRILHPPSSDNPTCLPVLILSVDDRKFLFNVPEGMTRVLTERGSRGASKKLKGIFVPRVGYDECGGLFGLLMSLADQSKGRINLYGPPIFSQFICTARMYAARENFQVTVNECNLTDDERSSSNSNVLYKDKDITVEAIPVYPNNFTLPKSLNNRRSPSPDRPAKKQRKTENVVRENMFPPSAEARNFLQLMFPQSSQTNGSNKSASEMNEENGLFDEIDIGAKRQKKFSSRFQKMKPPSLPPVKLTDAVDGQAPALTYIVKCSSVRGRFDVEKAKEMGVPHPSYYRKITEDLDIEISRPKDWLIWGEDKKKAWFKRQQAQYGKQKVVPQNSNDGLGKVETEQVMIYSKDLLAPAIPGTIIAQTYLPSIDYLDSFFLPQTQAQFDGLEEQLHCMVHAVHPDVLNEKRYQKFIKRFPNAHHYIASRPYIPDKLTYSSFALGMLRLGKIDSRLFKVPQYSLTPQRSLAKVGLDVPNVLPVGAETMIQLQPKREPDAECSIVHDINFPIDSPQAETMASFAYEPRSPTQTVTVNRGRQKWPKFLELTAQLQEEELQNGSHKMSLDSQSKSALDDLAITTLGTGSAMPSKYRNVSSALVHLPNGQGYILLDAGESTYGQLSRKFGKDVDNILRELRFVFLSHAHGDHHMGIAKLLAERKKLNVNRPLYVLSNLFTRLYLQEVNDIQPLDICPQEDLAKAKSGVIFLDSEDFDSWHGVHSDPQAKNPTQKDNEEEMYRAFIQSKSLNYVQRTSSSSSSFTGRMSDSESESKANDATMQTIQRRSNMRKAAKEQYSRLLENVSGTGIYTTEVRHRGAKCYAIILRGKGWSLAFSGDTMPCRRFIDAGQNVDILLHEATFENGEEKNASFKRHSTIGQALKVAKTMKAKRLLLTHFSQRYPHLPNSAAAQMVEESEGSEKDDDTFEPSVGISFDLMTMHANDIGKTERYREAMQLLFDVEGQESDDEGGDENGEGNGQGTSDGKSGGQDGGAPKEDKKAFKEIAENKHSQKQEALPNSSEKEQVAQSSKGKKDGTADIFQSKYLKEYEFLYIVAHILPQKRSVSFTSNNLPFSRLTFDDSLRRSLEELHGIVGGSFERDLIFFERATEGNEKDNSILAIIKVASPFAQQLISVIAGGVEIKSNSEDVFLTRYGGVLSAFDLTAVRSMIGTGGLQRSRRTIQPPGRAWMQSVVQSLPNPNP